MATKSTWEIARNSRERRLAEMVPGTKVRIKVWRCSIGYGYDVLAYNEDGSLNGSIREVRKRANSTMVAYDAVRWAEGRGFIIEGILRDRQPVEVVVEDGVCRVVRLEVAAS